MTGPIYVLHTFKHLCKMNESIVTVPFAGQILNTFNDDFHILCHISQLESFLCLKVKHTKSKWLIGCIGVRHFNC